MTKEQLIQIAKVGFSERVKQFINFENCEIHHMSGVYRLYDKDEDLAFGFCHLGDDQCAEWGYVSIAELRTVKVPLRMAGRVIGTVGPEWDRHWSPKKACEIEKIKRCQ